MNNRFETAPILWVILAVVTTGVLAGCTQSSQGGPGGARPTQVVAIDARSESVKETISLVGTLRANEIVEVKSEREGTIETIHFEEGDQVQPGQVLIQLETAKLNARLNNAKADFRLSEISYHRNKELFEDELISKQEFDEVTSTFDAKKATLELMKQQLDDATIKAPFGGLVGERHVSPGQVIAPSQSLTTLVDLDPIKLEAGVPERFLGQLQIGQTINVKVPAYPDRSFEGEVYFISPEVDPDTRNAVVKARIPNSDHRLKPGMFGNAGLTTEIRESAVVIPEAAIQRDGEVTSVFVVNNENKVESRPVEVGVRMEGRVEIRKGLQAGEKVIVEGIQKVRPGGSVTFAPKEEAEPYLKWLDSGDSSATNSPSSSKT